MPDQEKYPERCPKCAKPMETTGLTRVYPPKQFDDGRWICPHCAYLVGKQPGFWATTPQGEMSTVVAAPPKCSFQGMIHDNGRSCGCTPRKTNTMTPPTHEDHQRAYKAAIDGLFKPGGKFGPMRQVKQAIDLGIAQVDQAAAEKMMAKMLGAYPGLSEWEQHAREERDRDKLRIDTAGMMVLEDEQGLAWYNARMADDGRTVRVHSSGRHGINITHYPVEIVDMEIERRQREVEERRTGGRHQA